MKKFAFGMLAAVAMTGSAFAADMAPRYTKAPPPAPVAIYSWTGCYIGANVGGGWHKFEQNAPRNTNNVAFVPPLDMGSSDNNAFIGGAQIGCDYQFAGNWVVGVQGMFDFGDIRSRNNLPDARVAAIAPYSDNRTRDIYTGTARLGYLFAPQVLGYVKGGGAWTRTSVNQYGTIPAPTFLSQFGSADRSGWTVGGGLEYMFAKGWSVFGEYNYMDFGTKTVNYVTAPVAVGNPDVVRTKLETSTALVGVNYKFNFGGPVVAKY